MPDDDFEDGGDDPEVLEDAPEAEAAEADGRQRRFPCHGCGADLEWKPGQQALTCPYCGHAEAFALDETAIREYAFNDYLSDTDKQRGLDIDARACHCPGCAAIIDMDRTVAVQDCPFCGTMVEDQTAHDDRIRPEAVVPFRIERERARVVFTAWLASRWFAPSAFKREARADRFMGVYRSWWTFDSRTFSRWSGEAGTYYYVTRTRTVNGKTQTYRQRKTRWRRRSGTVERFFDDVLTAGFTGGLQPSGYQIESAKPYDAAVLAGFVCERYELDPKAAWPPARREIESELRQVCSRRLGGDTQRFLSVDTAHSGITFKSLLLPVWHSTYRYKGKVYRIAINGQNGTVEAERPYSVLKITALVLAIIIVIAALWFAFGG
ncbi:MAG: hypothetical protein PF961_23335 [Planctomycetota bacterium]|jgi:predicted RNA-binding Zn-ribbon protein involved in translation (DUF1610 family)|nr:hypothetical protein [Planctomycetota bacterium]